MSFEIEVQGGSSVRLPTAGKYCDRDIVVTAIGGGDTEGAYNEGYEAGQKAEYDNFWDTFQTNGTRTNYSYAFYGWNNNLYKPKYVPKPTAFSNMFSGSTIEEITIDLTNTSNTITALFGGCASLKKLTVYSSDNTIWAVTSFPSVLPITDLTIIGTISKGIQINSLTGLTHDSLMSVINALNTDTGGTSRLIMGEVNLAKLTDAEKAIATEKGWTLS